MKDLQFFLIVLFLSTIVGLSGYYIAINTISDKSKENEIVIVNSNLSFESNDELNSYISSEIYSSLNENLNISLSGYNYSIPIKELDLAVSYNLNTENEKNLIEAVKNGFETKEREEYNLNYSLNLDKVISEFPLNIQSSNPAVIINDRIQNCEPNEYYFDIDKNKLQTDLVEAIINKTDLIADLKTYLIYPDQLKIIDLCSQYNSQVQNLNNYFKNITNSEINIDEYFIFVVDSYQNLQRSYINKAKFNQLLSQIQGDSRIEPFDGEYVIENERVLMFKKPVTGRVLNINKSIESVDKWVITGEALMNPEFDILSPKSQEFGKEIIDFTKLVSVGQTRLDIIRGEVANIVLVFGQLGLEEMDYKIVMPGEEFSYIDTVNPTNGRMRSGRAIGGGICNSTTTVFRAALEGGFPITERHYHVWNVPSYDWNYPMNIVDAAFLESPRVDLKFVNDTKYPVIMRFSATRPGDGYQYHSIFIYSSENFPSRKVELSNFQKWNVRSETIFDASFDRKVLENGELIRTDTFESKYRARP